MNDLISVVILNYNGIKYLRDCFSSLQEQTYPNFEIIMIDNNSSDESVAFVKTEFPKILIIENKLNKGFAEGNNIGVRNAKGRYIALLNNDTIVNATWLSELYAALHETKNPLVGSFIHTKYGDRICDGQDGTINLTGYYIGGIFSKPTKTFFASGCSMLFDKNVIGLPFDPDYFFYSEDVYLSWLTRLRGYNVSQAPASIVEHIGSASTNKVKAFMRTFYQERNRLLNLLIFYSPATLLKLIPYLVFDALFRPLYIAANPGKSLRGWLKANIWLLTNSSPILKKRKFVQSKRKCIDQIVIENMSCRIANGKNIIVQAVNRLSFIYCLISGIKTIEISRRKT